MFKLNLRIFRHTNISQYNFDVTICTYYSSDIKRSRKGTRADCNHGKATEPVSDTVVSNVIERHRTRPEF